MKIDIGCLEENCKHAIGSGIDAGYTFGIGYWCDDVDMPELGSVFPIKFRESETGKWHSLTSEKLTKGVQIMANKYPHAFGNLLDNSKIDGALGDLLIQCCIFGEEKYG